VELKTATVLHVGACDNGAGKYALAKKKMTYEYLRGIMHLRPRTNTIGCARCSMRMHGRIPHRVLGGSWVPHYEGLVCACCHDV
jgi:hypothetical protein